MILQILIFIFVSSLTIFILYNNYNFQTFLRIKRKRKTIHDLLSATKGTYSNSGYFSSEQKILFKKEYRGLFKRQKANLHLCYSTITFQTMDATWEIFFTLIKESGKYKENLYLKCYPSNNLIHSKVSIEKIHSKLEMFSNNHSLMQILNDTTTKHDLNNLLNHNEETLNIGPRYIQYKSDVPNLEFTKTKILHKISKIHEIKSKVYTSNVKSY